MVQSIHESLFTSITTGPIIKKLFTRCFLAAKCRNVKGLKNEKYISQYPGVVCFELHVIIHWDEHP